MSSGLARRTGILAASGWIFLVLNVVAVAVAEPDDRVEHMFAVWAHIVAAMLQLAPASGIAFLLGGDRPWSPLKRSVWMIWIVASAPILALGTLASVHAVKVIVRGL